jgi:multisubunit Na+/H+ antiporter MnhB subunit
VTLKCPNCGKEVSENDKFCDKCGSSLAGATLQKQALPDQSSSSKLVLSIAAFSVSVVGFILIWLGLGTGGIGTAVGILATIASLIIGIIAIRKEPRGKVLGWIATILSAVTILIGILLLIIVLALATICASALSN